MPEDHALVRYVRNSDGSATGAIKFNDDDRPDLVIGGVGHATVQEINVAAANGVVLEPITESEAEELGLVVPGAPGSDSLEDLNAGELRQIASVEGVDLAGKRSKADIAAAIQEHRAAQPEGADSLPAGAPNPDAGEAGGITPETGAAAS